MMKPSTLPKDEGKPCIEKFEKHMTVIGKAMFDMVTELNTKPLVLLPVKFKDAGNGFVLAVQLDDGKFCPVARIASTTSLKDVIESVETEGAYTLVPQSELPGFKEFSAGDLWKA